MRIANLLLTSALLLAGAGAANAAGPEHKADGPCKTYFEPCKTSGKKGREMFKCVHDAATAASDKACLDDLANHKGHGGPAAGAPPKGE